MTHLLKRAGILSSLALFMAPLVQAEEFKDCLIVHLHGGSTVSYVLEAMTTNLPMWQNSLSTTWPLSPMSWLTNTA